MLTVPSTSKHLLHRIIGAIPTMIDKADIKVLPEDDNPCI